MSTKLKAIISKLTQQHKQTEQFFCEFEESVAKGDWDRATVSFKAFNHLLNQHIAEEEQTLFVHFEESIKSELDDSPTKIFRIEHHYILCCVEKLQLLLIQQETSAILETADELMVDIQSHVNREEKDFYVLFAD